MAQAPSQGAATPGPEGPPHPYDKRWYLHLDGKTYGPYAGHEIRQMVEQHKVVASDFVYAEGDSGSAWQQIANDPILGALFRSSETPRSPLVPRTETSPRGFRKWLFVIPVLFIAGWIGWPYYALYDLAVAVREGDVSALEASVAWDNVRQGLRGDLNAMLLQKIKADAATDKSSGAAFGTGLAVLLGPVVVDRMVDSYVTPQAVAAARPTAKNDDASSDAENVPKGFNGAIQTARHFRLDQIKYAFFSGGPLSFRVEFMPDHDPPFQHPTGLRFQWDGTWKLTRIMLPPDVLNTFPTTAKSDAPASNQNMVGPKLTDLAKEEKILSTLTRRKPAQTLIPRGTQETQSVEISQSEIDALRARISNCWSPPPGINVNSKLYVVLRVLFKPDGSMLQAPVLVEGSASLLAPALAESAKRALLLCQPFTMLKPEHYDQWKDIELKFDPHELLGG